MTKRRRAQQKPPGSSDELSLPNLLTLDRFTERGLAEWRARSRDLDELYNLLYFGLEPERIKRRAEILEALASRPMKHVTLDRWARVVDFRWSLRPLSSAGSLSGYGGRFNIGPDVDNHVGQMFPALYLGETYETAYREKYQCKRGTAINGLTPEEMGLASSSSTVFVQGHIERVFDVTNLSSLEPVCRILARAKLPDGVARLVQRLRLPRNAVFLIKNAAQMRRALQIQNWRGWPTQFGLPSPSQQMAELIRAAGFAAIQYRSSKDDGHCLAIFPDQIGSERSFVEICDPGPPELLYPRLDIHSADDLAGWEMLRPGDRKRDSL